jgi:tetratricopeptide (TPR) repeat protein
MKPLLFIILGSSLIVGVGCHSDTKPSITPLAKDSISEKDLAFQYLQLKIDKYPDSVRLYDKLIDTLVYYQDYQTAADIATQLVEKGADKSYYYWFVKGDIFRRGKMYDSAASAYIMYLRKFPDDEQILLNLANTYAEAGNENAIDLATNLARRFPNRQMRSEAFFIKGVYFNQIKQYAEARKWLDSTLMMNYNYPEAYMEKGYSFFDEEKYTDALKTFNTLINLNNQYADGWYWKGKCEEMLKKKNDAVESYTEAFNLDPSIQEAKQSVERLSAQ